MTFPVPLVPHDEPQPSPDELTHLAINHVWRRFIGDILTDYKDKAPWAGTEEQIDEALKNLDVLIQDFYTPGVAVGAGINFHGVRVVRYADVVPSIAGTNIAFESDSGNDAHDTDSYWSPTLPTTITIPAGLGGMYRLYAWINVGPGTGVPIAKIRKGGLPVAGSGRVNNVNYSFDLQRTMPLNAGAQIVLEVRMFNAADRTIFTDANVAPFAAALEAHLLGISV